MSPAPAEGPLISVVIPCFNQAHYLTEAIESALSQDYQPLEVIVVDDGSTDNTAEVASKYAAVRYVFQPNAGLAAARNRGIELSRGDYLVFLDADDRLCAEALTHSMESLAAHPDCGFVYGRFRFIDSAGAELQAFDAPPDNPDTYLGLFGGNHIAMCATVLCRKAVVDEVHGFRTELKAAEDYDLYFRIARRHSYRRHEAMVAECRRHGSNMTSNPALMLASTLQVVRAQRVYCVDEEHRRALESGLRLWRHYYGEMLARRIRPELRSRRFGVALRSVVHLIRRAPDVLGRLAVRKLIPKAVRQRLKRAFLPPSVRRVTPLSRDFGFDRGTPIDRYYIERFLAKHAPDVAGAVLEVKDATYTHRFGGARLKRSDVLDIDPQNPCATLIADLTEPDLFEPEIYDCVILTQTLQLFYYPAKAIRSAHRMLRPGGVVLATLPGISQIARDGLGRWNDHWRFTAASATRLFADEFGESNVEVSGAGNLAAAIAFLQGKAAEEMKTTELDFLDPDYPVVALVRAVKR